MSVDLYKEVYGNIKRVIVGLFPKSKELVLAVDELIASLQRKDRILERWLRSVEHRNFDKEPTETEVKYVLGEASRLITDTEKELEV